MYTDRKHGRPPATSLQVAVETEDGLFLLVPSKGSAGESRVSVYNVRASIAAGEQRNKLFHVTPGTNPYPGVGEPVYPGGPRSVRTHAVLRWVTTTNKALELGATTITTRSPLQTAREAIDGLARKKVVAQVSPPPVSLHAVALVEEQIGQEEVDRMAPMTVAAPAIAAAPVPPGWEPATPEDLEADAASRHTMRPVSDGPQLAVSLRSAKKGPGDPDAQEPNRFVAWHRR
jgi:hypothetical protein